MRKSINFYKNIFKNYGMTLSGANAAVRFAAYNAALTWSEVFIPKRFDPAYAMKLGYTTTKKYVEFKKRTEGMFVRTNTGDFQVASPQPWPFVFTGRSKANILGAPLAVTVVESGGRGYARIRVPLGAIAFKKAKEFTTVLPSERKAFLDMFEINLRRKMLPAIRAGVIPRDFKFTADQRGVQLDERTISHEQRKSG